MNNVIKGMIIVVILIYLLSPIDACPGPVDDLIAMLLGLAATRKLSAVE